MNSLDDSFQKLLNAAAEARREVSGSLPSAVEARVLAQWRTIEREDEFSIIVKLFRRAALFAFVLMALSGAWSYFENKSEASTLALASYAVKMQLPP